MSILPDSWTIRPTDQFNSELRKILKDKSKSDKGSGEILRQEVDGWLKQMLVNPMTVEGSFPEPYPNGYALQGKTLRKIHHKMASRGGGDNHIRLIYEVHEAEHCISLICVYSHGKYETRLPAKELSKRLRASRSDLPD